MNPNYLWKIATVVLLLSPAGCSFPGERTVAGDGHLVSQSREIGQFNEVSVSGSGELSVAQGSEDALTIEADENLLPLIQSEVRNGSLRIGPKDVNLRPSKSIRYELKLKNLNALEVSGSVNGETGALKTENLALRISGSGRIRVARLDAKQLSVDISGSGTTAVAGEVKRQEVRISGSGNHQAPELKCSEAAAEISGSGNATLLVNDVLMAEISGSGEVEYHGSPQVTRHVSGSGRVRQLDKN